MFRWMAKAAPLFARILLVLVGVLARPLAASQSDLQQAGGVQPSEPKFRVVRAVMGSKGSEQNGRYVIEDPRTAFYPAKDRQVIVYFEWEGPLGLHHLEGLWKGPDGKVTVVSAFDYEAKQHRFGGYWTLPLTDGVKTGLWALEARIDGEVAGAQTFQIVDSADAIPPAPTRRLLTPADLYKLALRGTVSIHRLGADGEKMGTSAGFLVTGGYILTAFDVIDGANTLKAELSDGKSVEILGVVAWNRREDWAVLSISPGDIAGLPLAQPEAWSVGDEYFSLQDSGEGARTLVAGSITGNPTYPGFGPRIHLSLSVDASASGSPILNVYGEVIGIMTHASLLPGSNTLGTLRSGYPANLVASGSPFKLHSVLALPITSVKIPSQNQPGKTLADLAAAGAMTTPLVKTEGLSFFYATIAVKVTKNGPVNEPSDSKFEFSRRDGQATVFLSLRAKTKIKGILTFRLHSLDNQLLTNSKPNKINLKPNQNTDTWWMLDVNQMPAATYRVDLCLDEAPIWRSFFRVVE